MDLDVDADVDLDLDAEAEVDGDADAEGHGAAHASYVPALLNTLGIGRAPLRVLVMSGCFLFGVLGLGLSALLATWFWFAHLRCP